MITFERKRDLNSSYKKGTVWLSPISYNDIKMYMDRNSHGKKDGTKN